jgi:hypothetical protein
VAGWTLIGFAAILIGAGVVLVVLTRRRRAASTV